MRAQNNKEIYKAYWKFSGYLAACVIIGTIIYWCYIQTSKVEVQKIVDKTEEYDKIYVRQTELTSRIDTLFLYVMMLNTNKNDAMLINSISKRKQDILSSMDDLSRRDIRLYQQLVSQTNTFLNAKDSIRTLRINEDLIKNDLMKCMEDNKQTTRKIKLGGITLNK